MAEKPEKRTRYNELLDIPNTIRDPDLYQLLGLDRTKPLPETHLEEAYRERMSKLQAIRSPKHKSFIEYLKGELRRARTVLADAKKRAEYDAEVMEERREQLTMILDVVLADGVLRPQEEERIGAVAAEVGLLPAEVQKILHEELKTRGARRGTASDMGAVVPAPAPIAPVVPAPGAAPGPFPGPAQGPFPPGPFPGYPYPPPGHGPPPGYFPGGYTPPPGYPVPPASPPAAPAPTPVPAAVSWTAPPPLAPSVGSEWGPGGEEEVEAEAVAELVDVRRPPPPTRGAPAARRPPPTGRPGAPPPARRPGPSGARPGAARPTSGWGQAAVQKPVGVCTACLSEVHQAELAAKKAEKLPDGRIHCVACRDQLQAGLLCGVCYQRLTRQELKEKQVVVKSGRAFHQRCAPK